MRPQMRERTVFIFVSFSSPSIATHMKRKHSFCIYIHIHIQASTSFFVYSDPVNDFDCSKRPFLDFCIEIPIRVCCAQQVFGYVCSIYPLDCPLFFLDLFHLPYLHHLLDFVLFFQGSGNVHLTSKLSMLERFWPHPRKDVGAWLVSAFLESLLYLYEQSNIISVIAPFQSRVYAMCIQIPN